jgi:LmbE family N-acetylglucosaminyl deacetylase
MKRNVLSDAIHQGVPLTVLAPHLDDAALSCGSLLIYAAKLTSVTVVTFFTEAGCPPYTFSARRYLHQLGAQNPQRLYQQRQLEDRAALEPLGISCVHVGLTDALFRRKPYRKPSFASTLIPEFAHLYPVYRKHVISGRIADDDAGTLEDATQILQRMGGFNLGVVLAPLGVGGHVDHVLVRTAAEQSGNRVVYYSDFPYNQRAAVHDGFIQDRGLVEMQEEEPARAKIGLIQAYATQLEGLFDGGRIPLVPEVYFAAPGKLQDCSAGSSEHFAKGRR